ncbi:hypothetical protein BOX15_Mlig030727g3 [Macrostomum lignano]|uniref:Uncharacterized protein n=1 Tax=Macrostomum lignano TaxID=282301 RepID=A0A267H5Z4_9PLAT|nr:hypothetical protein BOX15_Mlig030727g3 [Macrostomum lignano]
MVESENESEPSLSTDYSAHLCESISSPSDISSLSNISANANAPSIEIDLKRTSTAATACSDDLVPDDEDIKNLSSLSTISDPDVQAALIYQWAITSGVSEAALDRLLKLASVLLRGAGPHTFPTSAKVLKSRLNNVCSINDSCVSEISVCSECKGKCDVHPLKAKATVTLLDIVPQLRVILTRYIGTILQYEQELRMSRNSDVLNSEIVNKQNLKLSSGKELHLHLLISADGANFFESIQSSFWPFQAQILNLPGHIRQRFANLILIALVSSRAVPNFQYFLSDLMNRLPKQFDFLDYCVYVHCTLFVCDLPALAKLFCIRQFNGAFSCPKCLHPGESIKVSQKGSNWVFRFDKNHIFPLRTAATHNEHCQLANIRNKPVFGVKARSCLLNYISFPNCYAIDSLHCFFEGHIKYLLEELTSSANRHEQYFCSTSCLAFVAACIRNSVIPSSVFVNSNFGSFSDWKAKHFKSFALYFLFPTLVQRVTHLPLKLLLTNLVLLYHMLYNPRSNKSDIEKLAESFVGNAQKVFGPRILRLNFHLLLHIADQYELLGPVSFYSMFAFESAIGMFKKFLCGTSSFGSQLVLKFLWQKELFHYFSQAQDPAVLEAFNSISLEPMRSEGILRSSEAYVHGYLFSSVLSAGKSTSSNHLCILKSGEICSILEFKLPNHVRVQILEPIVSLFDYISSSTSWPEDLVEWQQMLSAMFKRCSSFNYVLVILSTAQRLSPEKFVNLADIDRPCIAVPVASYSKDCFCAIPLCKSFEHD